MWLLWVNESFIRLINEKFREEFGNMEFEGNSGEEY